MAVDPLSGNLTQPPAPPDAEAISKEAEDVVAARIAVWLDRLADDMAIDRAWLVVRIANRIRAGEWRSTAPCL